MDTASEARYGGQLVELISLIVWITYRLLCCHVRDGVRYVLHPTVCVGYVGINLHHDEINERALEKKLLGIKQVKYVQKGGE